MENYRFDHSFAMDGMTVTPVHVRVERHPPVIAAHRHSNTSYEIHYAQSGSGTVTVNGVSYGVRPGTLYITGRGIEHAQRSEAKDPVVEYCLYLNCRQSGQSAPGPLELFARTPFWLGEDEGRVFPLLCQMIEEFRHPQPDTGELLEALLRQLLVRLTRVYRHNAEAPAGEGFTAGQTPAQTMFAIEDSFLYDYRTLTLTGLAGQLNLSVRQTQRLLQSNFGMTFSQKLSEARMAAAAQFLTGTELSVTEISERLGFSSIEHFSAAFRRSMGCSPRQFRRERRSAVPPPQPGP